MRFTVLLLICVYAFIGITGSNRTINPLAFRQPVTVEQNKIPRGYGEPVTWKIRRHNLPEERFRTFSVVIPVLIPIPYSEHLRSVCSYNRLFAPITTRHYIPPPRDLPALTFKA